MVFSFFKKADVKMPAPVSVRVPKPTSSADVSAPRTGAGGDDDFLNPPNLQDIVVGSSEAVPQIPDEDWSFELDDTNTRVNGGYGVEILEESDPYAEIGEHAAVAYANGQNKVVQSTLENAVRDNSDPGSLRLWHMLFDFFRVTGDQAAFDTLGAEFARTCELSPPSWTAKQSAPPTKKPAASGLVALQGVLSGSAPALEILKKAVTNKEPRRLDFGRLAGIDPDGATVLAELLGKARVLDLAWGVSNANPQVDRLAVRLSSSGVGQESDAGSWQLLFELYHFLGREEDFEDKAVDYAVAFELSPPSWAPPKKPPAIPDVAAGETETKTETIERLEGTILRGNMEDVMHLLKQGEENRLDFSGVTRVDFVSAGMLVNILQAAGHVTIVHPNRLVAELLRVMGVDQVAKIELSRY